MSRRSRDPDSSLFPFLSVLACVIGSLTLLIAALAVGQVAESLQSADQLSDAQQAALTAEQAAQAELQDQLGEVARLGEEVAAARAELRALGVDPSASERERQRAVSSRAQAAQLARRLKELQTRDRQLTGSIKGIDAQLDGDGADADDRPIRILPHGSASPLRPFFIECREEGIWVYNDDLSDGQFLDRGNFEDEARFSSFLHRVRRVRDSIVVFMIRPDGVGSYYWARRNAEKLSIRHSKLPLPGFGQLEFLL